MKVVSILLASIAFGAISSYAQFIETSREVKYSDWIENPAGSKVRDANIISSDKDGILFSINSNSLVRMDNELNAVKSMEISELVKSKDVNLCGHVKKGDKLLLFYSKKIDRENGAVYARLIDPVTLEFIDSEEKLIDIKPSPRQDYLASNGLVENSNTWAIASPDKETYLVFYTDESDGKRIIQFNVFNSRYKQIKSVSAAYNTSEAGADLFVKDKNTAIDNDGNITCEITIIKDYASSGSSIIGAIAEDSDELNFLELELPEGIENVMVSSPIIRFNNNKLNYYCTYRYSTKSGIIYGVAEDNQSKKIKTTFLEVPDLYKHNKGIQIDKFEQISPNSIYLDISGTAKAYMLELNTENGEVIELQSYHKESVGLRGFGGEQSRGFYRSFVTSNGGKKYVVFNTSDDHAKKGKISYKGKKGYVKPASLLSMCASGLAVIDKDGEADEELLFYCKKENMVLDLNQAIAIDGYIYVLASKINASLVVSRSKLIRIKI